MCFSYLRISIVLLSLAAVPTAQGFKLNGRMPTTIVGDVDEFAFDAGGTRVFYTANQDEPLELFSVPPDRSTPPVRIDAAAVFTSSPDGSRLVYAAALAEGRYLRAVAIDGSSAPITLHGPLS